MLIISPPVAFLEFGPIPDIGCLSLIVTGSRDGIAPADVIQYAYAASRNPAARHEVIDSADHFLHGVFGQAGSGPLGSH